MRISVSALAFGALLIAAPAFCQNSLKPVDPSAENQDFTALRESMTAKNKALGADLTARREVVRKNGELLKEARKLEASNKKIMADDLKTNAHNDELKKQRETLLSGAVQFGSNADAGTESAAAPATSAPAAAEAPATPVSAPVATPVSTATPAKDQAPVPTKVASAERASN